jgi:hypothetical protein
MGLLDERPRGSPVHLGNVGGDLDDDPEPVPVLPEADLRDRGLPCSNEVESLGKVDPVRSALSWRATTPRAPWKQAL